MRQIPGGGTPRQIRGIPNGRDISRGAEDVFLIGCGRCHFIRQGLQRISDESCEAAEEGGQRMEIFYRLFLPPDFMKKEVNESVVFAMLKAAKEFSGFPAGDSAGAGFYCGRRGH